MLGAPRGQGLLGGLAPGGDRLDLLLHRGPPLPRLRRLGLGGGQRLALGPHVVADELPARLERLALQPGVELGRLGLALERTQPGARLALDVERAVEVVLGAGELELGATPALAVLAQAGGLLDQQAPVARLGGHERLDPALGDDRVHLLAQAGVREHLDHVDQPAARAGEAVLALARCGRAAAGSRPRAWRGRASPRCRRARARPRRRGRPGARRAAEDHVLHRLAAHGDRRLLARAPTGPRR